MSNKLKRMLENRAENGRIVTPRVDKWLLDNDGIFLDKKLAKRITALMTKRSGDYTRAGVLHPSSEHLCMRRQLFSFLDVEGVHHFDSALQNRFNNGTWIHMRWQAMLMEAGILHDIEVPVTIPKYRLRGSMDGQGTWKRKEFGFELKGWSAIPDEPKDYHVRQIQTYMFASGLEQFSVVYEHKSSQDWTEFLVDRDDDVIDVIEERLKELNGAIDNEVLIAPLRECRRERGEPFKSCPYRKVCLDYEPDMLDWGILE